jgi:hypothetical protein
MRRNFSPFAMIFLRTLKDLQHETEFFPFAMIFLRTLKDLQHETEFFYICDDLKDLEGSAARDGICLHLQ